MLRPFLIMCVMVCCAFAAPVSSSFDDIPAPYKKALFAPAFLDFITKLTAADKKNLMELGGYGPDLEDCAGTAKLLKKKDEKLGEKTEKLCDALKTKKALIATSATFFKQVYKESVKTFYKSLPNNEISMSELRSTMKTLINSYKNLDVAIRDDLAKGFSDMKVGFDKLLPPATPYTIPDEYKVDFTQEKVRKFFRVMNSLTVEDILVLGEVAERSQEFGSEEKYLKAIEDESIALSELLRGHIKYEMNFKSLEQDLKDFINEIYKGRPELEKQVVLGEQLDQDQVDDAVKNNLAGFKELKDVSKKQMEKHFRSLEYWFSEAAAESEPSS